MVAAFPARARRRVIEVSRSSTMLVEAFGGHSPELTKPELTIR